MKKMRDSLGWTKDVKDSLHLQKFGLKTCIKMVHFEQKSNFSLVRKLFFILKQTTSSHL